MSDKSPRLQYSKIIQKLYGILASSRSNLSLELESVNILSCVDGMVLFSTIILSNVRTICGVLASPHHRHFISLVIHRVQIWAHNNLHHHRRSARIQRFEH
eukprot:GABV01007655.1.p1 GENE.GABV01007655.1~~GABV01007655.1.p1  ORF type:complete len:101 (-),score=4.51 GABV01007655.1:11-313(-)